MNNEYIRKRLGAVKGEVGPVVGLLRKRLITRNVMAEVFKEFGFKIGAEVGVYRGDYSQILLDTIPDLKLYLVDPWFTLTAGEYSHQGKQRRNFMFARQRLVNRNVEYIVKSSQDALVDIPDDSLDFVYIDADHTFDHAMLDLIGWSKKVRKGGIVSGHDYLHHSMSNMVFGVVTAVDAYTRAHGIFDFFITQEFAPSYMWIKS